MILREKLMNTLMNQGEDVTSYLIRLRLVKDELATIGDSLNQQHENYSRVESRSIEYLW